MVDHTFLYTGAVQKMKELIEEEAIGGLCISIRHVSTWDYSSLILMCSGTLLHMTFPF